MESAITLFHFTTWQLTDKDMGKILDVSWATSNYWKQKLTKGWVPSIAPLPNNVVVNGVDLSQLNELLSHMKYTSELLKEYVFDEIRSNEYPLKPSRRKCMFTFSATHNPDEYAKHLGFDRTRYQLLTLRVLPETRLHSGDMGYLNTN